MEGQQTQETQGKDFCRAFGKERKTMSEERNLLEMEAEKQETREFIELFRAMPKDKRRDVKYIMVGVNLMNQKQEERQLV